jgi:hypothetical protein
MPPFLADLGNLDRRIIAPHDDAENQNFMDQ